MQRLNWGTEGPRGAVPQKGRGETSFYLPDDAGSQNTALRKRQELGEKEKKRFSISLYQRPEGIFLPAFQSPRRFRSSGRC